MTRVLVTGATGFLGGHVVRRLEAAGATVTGLDLGRDGDLADPEVAARTLSPWRWDVAVNLAGPVTGGNEDLRTGIDVVAAHVRIALHLRRHAGAARIVHASSMTVYGPPDRLPVAEDHPRRPQHLYGLAKVLAEDVVAPNAAILRLPGLFSAERRSGALYHFCRAARRGEPVRVTTPTPTVWDVLHVEDAADAIARAVTSHVTGALNISYGEPVELGAVARWIAEHAGTGSPVECTTKHPVFQLSVARARQTLGWAEPSLHARLAELYAAYASADG